MKSYKIPIYKVQLVRDGSVSMSEPCTDSRQAFRIASKYLEDADRENFIILALNNKSKVIGVHTATVGTLSHCVVSPREVFKFALLMNASTVIVAHNHHSGDPTPSREDIEATKTLVAAGKVIGIPVLDHIVIGEQGHVSLHELGEIE